MYMSILGEPTDHDLAQCSHVLLARGIPLYWITQIQTHVVVLPGHLIDQHYHRNDECCIFPSKVVQTLSIFSVAPITCVQKYILKPSTIDYNKLILYFGWVNADTIKKIFENSTQWAVASTRFPIREQFKSRFRASQHSPKKQSWSHT